MRKRGAVWPKVPAPFVRAMLAGHSALGLAFAALIYLVCFSGVPAVFVAELERWEQVDAPVLTGVSDQALQRAAADGFALASAAGEVHALYLYLPESARPRLQVRWINDDGEGGAVYVDAEGRPAGPVATPFATFVADLHTDLRLPQPWGAYLVGLTGVALLSSLISGMFSHPRVFRDAFHLRWGGARRLQEADLHNRISVWALPFHFVVSLTGAFLGLAGLVVLVLALAAYDGDQGRAVEAVLGPQPGPSEAAAPLPDLAAIRARVLAMEPEAEGLFVMIEHPATEGQVVTWDALAPRQLAAAERYHFHGDGRFIRTAGASDGPVGIQLFAAMTPLHFGTFGGLPVKIVYGVLGLGLCVVASSGVSIWLARRRDRGRPAPRWERVWRATVWSQPLAYGLSAAATLGVDADPLAVWCLATLAAFAVAAFARSAEGLSRALKLAGGVALLLAAGTALATGVGDGMRPALSAVIALLGVALAAGALRRPVPAAAQPLPAE